MKSAKTKLILELASALVFGLCFNATLLRDADTWWLLGLGKWICEHRALPVTDPFSYTMAFQAGREYLPHQWLSALLFYFTYNFSAIQGLLMLSVGVLFGAFVLLPLRFLRKTTTTWVAFALVLLGVCAGKFHFLARPEIFSYLFEALLLTCLAEHRLKRQTFGQAQQKKIDFALVASIFGIFALWCNFHSGFVFGVLFLCAYCGMSLLVALWKRRSQYVDLSVIVSLCLLPIAVCVNPFGFGLLRYLVKQLWFDPLLDTIGEMTPINLFNPSFFPFFILVALYAWCCLKAFRRNAKAKLSSLSILVSLAVVASAVLMAFLHRRAILFAVPVILFECAVLFAGSRSEVEGPVTKRFAMPDLLPIFVSMVSIPIAFTWFGCDNRWDTKVLRVVDKGVEYIRDHARERRIFNDFVLGDRMIWLTPQHPRVFLDTRYDMYGQNIVDEYDVLSMGQPGWKQVLDKYQIEMVCFFKKSRIADLLSEEPGWAMVYLDERTIVFERTLEPNLKKQISP